MIGRTVSHYEILEKLGEGGMGVVYKAHDTTLHRTVALKFLPSELTRDADAKARFLQEAHAAAALNHPGICTVFEIGEAEDTSFIAMECVEGRTLGDEIAAGDVTPERALDIGIQVADALREAHSKGIVHRDIKPTNIMVGPGGRAKIMDFGLARLAGSTLHTRTGTTLGTAAYMSPEQARGIPVDERADVWSLGVVLYEMATGRRPFRGDHAHAVIYSVIHDDPEPPSSIAEDLPPELDGILAKALVKERDDRYQSAAEMLTDLRALGRGESVTVTLPVRRPRTVGARVAAHWRTWAAVGCVAVAAVLVGRFVIPREGPGQAADRPRVLVATFENRTGDPSLDQIGRTASTSISEGAAQTGFVDLVTNAEGDATSGVTGQGVSDAALLANARKANASILVAGSYRVQSDSLHMKARLLDVSDGMVLNDIPDEVGPLATATTAIARTRSRVMGAIGVRTDDRILEDSRSYAPTWEAYQQFAAAYGFQAVSQDTALMHWERAFQLDPGFKAARMAGELNRIWYRIGAGRRAEADSLLQEILSHPGNLTPHAKLEAEVLAARNRGDHSEALRKVRELARLEPDFPFAKYLHAGCAMRVNRCREAVDVCAPLLDHSRKSGVRAESWVYEIALRGHHLLGEFERQLEIAQEATEAYPDVLAFRIDEAGALARLGRIGEIDRIIEESTATPMGEGSAPSAFFGTDLFWLRAKIIEELGAHGHAEKAAEVAEDLLAWQRGHMAVEDNESWATFRLAWACYYAERWEEALPLFEQWEPPTGYEPVTQAMIGCLAARPGDRERALEIKQELLDWDIDWEPGVGKYFASGIALYLGEREEALDLLRLALAEGNDIWWDIHADPDYIVLKDYPPFQRLIEPRD